MAPFVPVPLRNSRFKTQFKIRRTVTTVDDDGINVPETTILGPFEGVVVPSGSLGMTRDTDTEQQAGGITVYAEEPISLGDASGNQPADEILWPVEPRRDGQPSVTMAYQVTAQDDWGDFGFNVAQCSLVEPGGRAVA